MEIPRFKIHLDQTKDSISRELLEIVESRSHRTWRTVGGANGFTDINPERI
jgi:hypothetical protein